MSKDLRSATAVRITGEFSIDALTYDTVEITPPGAGQVLVAIKAVSLNYRDLLVVTGRYSPNLPKPLVIASDGAGEVIAVGEGVRNFKVGERVAGSFFQNWERGEIDRDAAPSALGGSIDGVLATARVFEERGLVHVPEHLSYEEAATLPCAAVTVWNALVHTAHVKSGDTVLLMGTGGVSIFGLQFAAMHGARTIITSSSDDKLARATKLGASETINYLQAPEWHKEVLRLTNGRGVDIVLEVGGAGTLAKSLRAVRPGGQVSLIGVLAGIADPLNIGPILHNSVRLQGIYVGSVEMFEAMNRAIAANKLKPVVDRTFSFEQAREALRYMENGRHFGKIVIRVAE
ncbi:MAG TPA: NAD(P)-dependent alcohol dehydrogenase [Candidatus Acidoferrales bacterium]|nr:NAD(P)-dependent alcohol dehydrogenase [Candidatus Acidoferrales bacterium]